MEEGAGCEGEEVIADSLVDGFTVVRYGYVLGVGQDRRSLGEGEGWWRKGVAEQEGGAAFEGHNCAEARCQLFSAWHETFESW